MKEPPRKGEQTTVGVEQLTLTNSLTLTALVELLEEKGILSQPAVLERMRQIRDRKKAS